MKSRKFIYEVVQEKKELRQKLNSDGFSKYEVVGLLQSLIHSLLGQDSKLNIETNLDECDATKV